MNNTKTFSIRIPEQLILRIENLAQKEGRSRNNLITRILTEYMNYSGDVE